MNPALLKELKKSLERYTIIEDKKLIWKAIQIYHGYLWKCGYRLVYDPVLRKRNKK